MKLPMENKSEPLLSFSKFLCRQLLGILAGALLIAISLAVGMWGYHHFEGLDWVDSYVNASMILSGMGPLKNPESTGGKVFAGTYALYSGFAVLAITAIVFGPLIHRLLHRLHIDEKDLNGTD